MTIGESGGHGDPQPVSGCSESRVVRGADWRAHLNRRQYRHWSRTMSGQ